MTNSGTRSRSPNRRIASLRNACKSTRPLDAVGLRWSYGSAPIQRLGSICHVLSYTAEPCSILPGSWLDYSTPSESLLNRTDDGLR